MKSTSETQRMMRVGVLIFPGSNGDHDALYALGDVLGQRAEMVWHTCTDLSAYDLVVLPGGFSYGDYLRAGAIARFAPVMDAVKRYAEAGGWVLGICNGFQILTEAHLLPGALMRNAELSFSCRWVNVRVEPSRCALLGGVAEGRVWRLPIAHGEGRYFADDETLARLEENRQIVLRYCTPDGSPDPTANPNGSSNGIAGICNREGNVMGLMPHPERAAEAILGSDDGRLFLQSVVEAWKMRNSEVGTRGASAREELVAR
jgi:phosphoribosylformylglycinamidine synthase subunit PurQ / glutaminase